ncbi:MAG: ABC transporter permease [Clostridia bacterium]|nr:ABC transporter permease [Clostridia bacterium]
MNNKKIKEIIKFSLRKNIQNKWFAILNCLLFAIIVATLNFSNIKNYFEDRNINLFYDEIKINYIDNENLIGTSLEEAFLNSDNIEVVKIKENNFNVDNIDNNIIVEIFSSSENILEVKIISKESISNDIYDKIVEPLNEARKEIFSKQKNIDKTELEKLGTGIPVERLMLGVDSENAEKKEFIKYISTIIVYMISIFVFSKIANDITHEKVSKSVEYILTSVTAKEYLLAKIMSIVITVLLQAIYLVVYYFIGNLINNLININNFKSFGESSYSFLKNIDIDLIKYIIIVFVYGFLTIILMSIIQATLSSKTTSMQESGNSMMFLLTITMAVYFVTFGLITPYTNMKPWIYIVSCIPLISNYFIPAIIIIGQAKKIQIFISFILLLVSIPISFNICSKIFKNGILDYNQKKNKKSNKNKELSLLEEQEIKLEKSKYKKFGFVVGFSIILYVVLQIFTSFLIEVFLVPIISNLVNEEVINIIIQILVSIIGLGGASLFTSIYITKQDKNNELDKKSYLKLFYVSIFLIGLLQFVLLLIQNVIGVENKVSELVLNINGLDNPLICLLLFIEVAIIPAIFEELFFRKCLIDLSIGFGEKFAVIFSSIIFGVSHFNLIQGVFAFLMGLILGTLYIKTKSMKYNSLLHFLNNGVATIAEILLFNSLVPLTIVFEISILIILVLSGMFFIKELIKTIRSKRKIKWLNGKLIPNNFKYILTDYTVIISVVLVVLMFITTETLLKIM